MITLILAAVVSAQALLAPFNDRRTDRASVLLDVRVREVQRRRRSKDGLVRHPDPLQQAPRPIANSSQR